MRFCASRVQLVNMPLPLKGKKNSQNKKGLVKNNGSRWWGEGSVESCCAAPLISEELHRGNILKTTCQGEESL